MPMHTKSGNRSLLGAACALLAGAEVEAYQCSTDTTLSSVTLPTKKGIAVDDSTLHWCTSQIPDVWPNANGEVMSSIRLFKAWDELWSEEEREAAWSGLVSYVTSVNAKVMIGTQITCDETADNTAWEWTKTLLSRLQPEHVMGLGIGNELELLQYKDSSIVPAGCTDKIWNEGYLWTQFQRMTSEFDALGFSSVPITSVFTGLGLAGDPFYEVPQARVNTFLTQATEAYGTRFVFVFNFYPYFDPSMPLDAGTTDECSAALAATSCFGTSCSVPAQTKQARLKMKQLTGSSSSHLLWIGETGWSSERADTLTTAVKSCTAWSSVTTFKSFYKSFLEWDLELGDGYAAPDHVFWFTMRDSINFGESEYFGLVSSCDEPKCKIASSGYEAAYYALHRTGTESCDATLLYDGWAQGQEGCANKCSLTDGCKFYALWPHSHDGNYWCQLTATCASTLSVAGYEVSIYTLTTAPETTTPKEAEGDEETTESTTGDAGEEVEEIPINAAGPLQKLRLLVMATFLAAMSLR